MTIFWLIAVCLIVVTLFVCIRSVINTSQTQDDPRLNDDRALLQQRLNELDNDLENGIITSEEAENSRKEIQLAILNRKKQPQQAINPPVKFNRITAVFLSAFIPVFVLLFYSYLGRPDLIVQPPLQASQEGPMATEQIEQMVVNLEQRLQQEPDNVDGWLMFYRSNMVLERYEKALLAAEKLYQLEGEKPEVLLRYVDAMAMVNNQQLAGKPTELLERILELEPDNISAIWLYGMAASERGDYQLALDYWEGLLPRIQDEAEPSQQLQQMIAYARQQLRLENNRQNKPTDINPETTAITINVYLAPNLTENISNEALLFVYARSQDGNAMPIAVVREPIQAFPVQVTLDNSNLMMPSRKLADFNMIQLIARISNSGQAKPENGDLIGAISNISPLVESPVDLIIRDKVQL